MSAELMVALVQRAGHKLRVIETDAQKCTVEGERADDKGNPSRLTWSMEDAKTAGVTGKGPWKSYPAAMLRARAISALCRYAFADVLMGTAYTPEELGAEVGEAGEVLEGEVVGEGQSGGAGEPREVSEHQALLSQINDVYLTIPEDQRPDAEQLAGYAGAKIGNARKALERVHKLAEEASEFTGEASEATGEPAEDANAGDPRADNDTGESAKQWYEDHPGEFTEPEGLSDEPGSIGQEQWEYAKELADELYEGKDKVPDGHEWLQREHTGPLADLSSRAAYKLTKKLQEIQKQKGGAAA